MIEREPGVPPMGRVSFGMVRGACCAAFSDMRAAPGYGLLFAGVYVAIGWVMLAVTRITGQSYWLVFAAVGFPLIGPFAAVGLYEVSHRLGQGAPLVLREILGVVASQRSRQLPSICAVIIIVFLFWFFLAHMIFALFLGLSAMTNVSTTLEVYMTANGIQMLVFGTVVGAGFALLLYMITVIALPLLLDREVDFVTAMITSFHFVLENRLVMLSWGALIAATCFIALLPGFFGLFLALPFFGHASWHLYRLVVRAGAAGSEAERPQQAVTDL